MASILIPPVCVPRMSAPWLPTAVVTTHGFLDNLKSRVPFSLPRPPVPPRSVENLSEDLSHKPRGITKAGEGDGGHCLRALHLQWK